MPRFARKPETKRSEHWLRVAIRDKPHELSCEVKAAFGWADAEEIDWLSPVASDNYCEYGDQAFLDRLGVRDLKVPLRDFWPNRGPQWDGLARTASGKLLLVEAKAHIAEAVTFESKASPASLAMIHNALDAAKRSFNASSDAPWPSPFYQYANRLAHLFFMRELNDLDAYMLFVYFADAPDVPIAATREQWAGADRVIKLALGLGRHRYSQSLRSLVVSVPELLAGT